MEQCMKQLVEASRVMSSPASQQTGDTRKAAEKLLLEFKQSEKPYQICTYILENSGDSYLYFVACSTIKEALMREWNLLTDDDKDGMRDYLLNFCNTHQHLSGYVLRQMLHVVALVVKRTTLTKAQDYLSCFVDNVCGLLESPNTIMLGLELCSSLIDEFTIADKTLLPYMSYRHNLDCKEAMEDAPLFKIFIKIVQLASGIRTRVPTIKNDKSYWIKVMTILHSILSWDFTVVLSKRLAQISNMTLPVVNLRPPAKWAMLKEHPIINLLGELYLIFEIDEDLQHLARLCLVQLGTLQGAIFTDQEDRVGFLQRYLGVMVKLISRAITIESRVQDHGLSLAVRQLLWSYTSYDINNIDTKLWEEFIRSLTELTIHVLRHSTLEDEGSTQDVVDVLFDSWFNLVGQADDLVPNNILDECMLKVVECYVQCHMAPPIGIRNDTSDMEEIDIDTEEDDRVRYRDQLHIVGALARRNLGMTLPLLTRLLLQRAAAIRERVENQEECMPKSDKRIR